MLLHTDLAISAWDHSRLIGFGRVLTDYVFRASIWDVLIDRDYQGQDFGPSLDSPSRVVLVMHQE